MVRVPVDDQHPLGRVAERGGGDRDVVQQAEAHRVAGLGVVAGRPHRAERGVAVAPFERLDRRESGPGGEDRRVPRRRGRRGVAIEGAAAAPAERLELVQVGAAMHPLDLGPSGDPRRELPDRAVEVRGAQALEHGLQAGRPLRMPATGIVLRVSRVGRDQQHRRRLPTRPGT